MSDPLVVVVGAIFLGGGPALSYSSPLRRSSAKREVDGRLLGDGVDPFDRLKILDG